MKILVACEFTGIVRDAFLRRGHDAVSCDLLPTESPGPHIQGDVLGLLDYDWDMMLAFPPCTHLAASGARWWKQKQADGRQAKAIGFFVRLMDADIKHICCENPVGVLSRAYRKPDQYIQPFWFGDSVQKKTGLWLQDLPLLEPSNIVDRGMIYVDPRGNKHGGEHTLRAKCAYSPLMMIPGGRKDRWKIRSRTFQGIADAMADQWDTDKLERFELRKDKTT